MLEALQSLGSDAYGLLPAGAKIELIEAASSNSTGALHQALLRYADEIIAIVVLGASLTSGTSAAGSNTNALGNMHNEVRQELTRADKEALALTVKRDILTPFVLLNFGDNVEVPDVYFEAETSKDVQATVDNIAKLLPFGLKVSQTEMREMLGLREPEEGEALLEPAAGADGLGLPAFSSVSSFRGASPRASRAAFSAEDGDEIDAIIAGFDEGELDKKLMSALRGVLQPVFVQLLYVAQHSLSEHFMTKISLTTAQGDAEAGFSPKLHANTLVFAPALLKSALFKAAKGPRVTHFAEVEIAAHNPAKVRILFTGEELQQDDLRVLLALIKLREGSLMSRKLQFSPREFCVGMGRADSSSSVAVLKDSLIRLQKARVRVMTPGLEAHYSFVSDVEFERGIWRVWLSERVAALLADSTFTCIDKDVRFGAKDGIESWLYSFVKADACFVPFKLESLQAWTGLTGYAPKEFARVLRKELNELVAAGEIDSFDMKDGKVRITKRAAAEVH